MKQVFVINQWWMGCGAVVLLAAGCVGTPRQEAGSPQVAEQAAPTEQQGYFAKRLPGDLRVLNYNVNFDSIFPEKNALRAERFRRIVQAMQPDVVTLQEIRRPAEDVGKLLDEYLPLSNGRTWQAYKGHTNVIASRYPLSYLQDETDPPGQRKLALGLVDLPDQTFDRDLYIVNNHFKCCGDPGDEEKRRWQADAVATWLYDATAPGGKISLPQGTAILIIGDFNTVEGQQPSDTVIRGQITDQQRFTAIEPPDWDRSDLADGHLLHNGVGPDDYTWRDDSSPYEPKRIDYVLYTDSVMELVQGWVLNTLTLDPAILGAYKLLADDIVLAEDRRALDHLPLIVDLRMVGSTTSSEMN
ncbi:MAG: hypothetical protein HJJLKODD_01528 [Phycisphaerae bacterium]|nr:hypothetical protein [Phycisphaerae bacterium]